MESPSDDCIWVVGVGTKTGAMTARELVTARLIRASALPGVRVVEQSGAGTALIDLWQTTQPQIVYLIDAMTSGVPLGSIARFEAHHEPLPAQLGGAQSSHLFGVVQAVEMARVLGCLPPQLIVYGIEGKHFEFRADLSPEVEAATRTVAEDIMRLIQNHSCV